MSGPATGRGRRTEYAVQPDGVMKIFIVISPAGQNLAERITAIRGTKPDAPTKPNPTTLSGGSLDLCQGPIALWLRNLLHAMSKITKSIHPGFVPDSAEETYAQVQSLVG